jgi:hypothetical protein
MSAGMETEDEPGYWPFVLAPLAADSAVRLRLLAEAADDDAAAWAIGPAAAWQMRHPERSRKALIRRLAERGATINIHIRAKG